jgi:hypothetical protein
MREMIENTDTNDAIFTATADTIRSCENTRNSVERDRERNTSMIKISMPTIG